MILTKEQILTLTCLKEVGIKGVGPQKIFAIGAAIDDRGLEIKSYEDLAQLMSGIKEKAINKVTLSNLNDAYQIARKIIEASAKQSKEFNESLKKMQETNGELNKSLQKLTAQNTQAAKDLQAAKDRARDLEKQLQEALSKNKGCSSGCLGMVAAIVSITSVACWLVCLMI